MYLLDTNVVSARTRGEVHDSLSRWIVRRSSDLYLSTISVTEIESGIAKLRRTRANRRADDLGEWLEALLHTYAPRILPFDIPAARAAGTLTDISKAIGRPVGFPDIAIAATAKVHELTLLTRNIKDFGVFGIPVHDPFRSLPD